MFVCCAPHCAKLSVNTLVFLPARVPVWPLRVMWLQFCLPAYLCVSV